MAALYTVISLREKGFDGEITMVSAEQHHPYDRPPLSKEVLAGKTDSSMLDADWHELELDLRLGVSATSLEAHDTVVTTEGDLGFDRLVIATGSFPLWLPGSEGLAGVHVLRTIEDSLQLRAALQPGAKVVIIGAGWIGAEVATAAATAGCEVTVVEGMEYPLAAAMPREIGSLTEAWYAEAGIRLLLSSAVASVRSGAVLLASGEEIPAHAIVVGIGVRPQTAWVGDALERSDRGAIVVDERCRTSRGNVFAVGDCTVFASRRFGRDMHVEHWDNARRQPLVAAANIVSAPDDPDLTYDPVPYFWSQQLGRMVQYVGSHDATDELVWRWPPTEAKWSAFWLSDDDRITAAIGVSRPRDVIQARGLIESGARVDRAALTDTAVQVSQAGPA